ncbi:hypothetical protein ACFQL0_15705 [Haloplanus litoreus]|uniref:hypothetical protein n=1 Tax=Haloplanus litoreus TaxID=767515 RepID=UPI003616D0AD
MTDENRMAITFDDFPEPIIAYAVEGGEPRITVLNGAFESVFDCLSSGMPVAAIFEQFSVVNPTDGEDPIAHLRRGDSVGIYLDGIGEEVRSSLGRSLPALIPATSVLQI